MAESTMRGSYDLLVRGLPCVGKSEVASIAAGELNATRLSTDNVRANVPFLDIFRKGQTFANDERATKLKGLAYDVVMSAGVLRAEKPTDIVRHIAKMYQLSKNERKQIVSYYDGLSQRNELNQRHVYDGVFAPSTLLAFHQALAPSIIEVEAPLENVVKMALCREALGSESQASINIHTALLPTWVSCRDTERIGRPLPFVPLYNHHFDISTTELIEHISTKDTDALKAVLSRCRQNLRQDVYGILRQLYPENYK